MPGGRNLSGNEKFIVVSRQSTGKKVSDAECGGHMNKSVICVYLYGAAHLNWGHRGQCPHHRWDTQPMPPAGRLLTMERGSRKT